MARGPEKYTRYLTDPYGTQVAYDVRYPQQKERLQKEHAKIEARLAPIREAKAFYQPGGGFGKGVEAGLERGRVKAMASGMQHLVGAGLAGTTMAGTLGKKYGEEVAAPTRMGVEEQRAQALSGISMQQAGMEFQAGEAGLQRGFQAGQTGAQRDLQRYIADLQATLQREQMASRGPTITAPTGGYAQQFPSIYDQGGAGPSAPPMPGGGTTTPTSTMAPFGGTFYGSQGAFETSLESPESTEWLKSMATWG